MNNISYTIQPTKEQIINRIAKRITALIISILLLIGAFMLGYQVHKQLGQYTSNELEIFTYYQ